MKKKEKASKKGGLFGSAQMPVLIMNTIIAVIGVVALVTLYVGTFWSMKIDVSVDKKLLEKLLSSESETPEGIKATSEDSFEISDIMQYLDDDFALNFQLQLDLQGEDLVMAAFGTDQTNTVREEVAKQVNAMVESLSGNFKEIMKVAVKAVVQIPVEKAKEAIREELSAESKSTDEEAVTKEMETKYGITEEQIDELSKELTDTIDALMEGDTQKSRDILSDSATLDSLIAVYAEQQLQSGETAPTQEEIDQKAVELKNDVLKQYDDTIESLSVDGEFSLETAVYSLISETGLLGEEDTEQEGESGESEGLPFKDEESLKSYVTNQLMAILGGDEVMTAVTVILRVLGICLLLVMASWLYVIIKIIVKLFFKNKTISFAAPRAIGWMPHVFLVGIPSLLILYLPQILAKVTESLEGGISEKILAAVGAISFSCHSLTWVSALCTVLLLVVGIFYRPIRKKAKNG